MLTRGTRLATVIVIATGAIQTASAQSILPGTAAVELKLVATVGSEASTPNFGAHSGDPRFLYVGQKTGEIRILDFDQPNPLLGTTFLNVSTALDTFRGPTQFFHEYGLLGGAFHPDFNSVGTLGYRKFYTYTSENIVTPVTFTHPEIGNGGNHQSVIREWTAGTPNAQGVITIDTGIPSRVLMRINQPQDNHNGGALAFGPDNYLYIALGDGGSGNDFSGNVNSNTDGHTNQNNPDVPGGFLGHGNAQDRRNVFGSILRIKPTTDADASTSPSANGQYRIPSDNPFTSEANLVDEIFAYGLRNPFRMSFDSATGKLYSGDVGQGAREEVNVIENGGNYGWVAREGTIQNPTYPLASFPTYVAPADRPFINPIAEYLNTNAGSGGQAVIGGFVYRGGTIPALEGKYVFGDYNRQNVGSNAGGRLMYMDINEPGLNQIFDLTITGPLAKPTARLHGIAEDANGELYYLFQNGQIIRLLPELIPGDYNRDGRVDDLDYQAWRAAFGNTGANLSSDGNGDGVVDAADYILWRKNLGATTASGSVAVPEPATAAFVGQALALLAMGVLSRRRLPSR